MRMEGEGGGGGAAVAVVVAEGGKREEEGKKKDLMKFRYQLRTNMQNISLEIK